MPRVSMTEVNEHMELCKQAAEKAVQSGKVQAIVSVCDSWGNQKMIFGSIENIDDVRATFRHSKLLAIVTPKGNYFGAC